MNNDQRALIRAETRRLGFDAVGFARATLPDTVGAQLDGFLAAGHQGDMAWLATGAERRRAPQGLWPEARSVIVLGVNYAPGPGADPRQAAGQPDTGVISVYARNLDYHEVIKRRLKALARWLVARFGCEVKVFVDTAPVMEKPLAAAGGLGWVGNHTNLVSRRFGSWLFLGEVFTTLELEADPQTGDHCGRCRRCLDACPTAALVAPRRIDARRCVSYLTIEHKGSIPVELRARLGNRIYGCDDCLAACPWNRFATPTTEVAFQPRDALVAPRLAELLELDDAGFRALFAKSPIRRVGRARFVRNVLIAAGNAGPAHATELEPACRRLLDDPEPLVHEAAKWAVGRLNAIQ